MRPGRRFLGFGFVAVVFGVGICCNSMPLLSHIIGLVLCIVWIFSLWLLLAGRRWFPAHKPLRPLALLGGTLLFFVLSLTGMVFLQVLFSG